MFYMQLLMPNPGFQERGTQFQGRIAIKRRATFSARARQLTSQASRGENLPELSGGPSSYIDLRRRIMQAMVVWAYAFGLLSAVCFEPPADPLIFRARLLPENTRFSDSRGSLASLFHHSFSTGKWPSIHPTLSGTVCKRSLSDRRCCAVIQGAKVKK